MRVLHTGIGKDKKTSLVWFCWTNIAFLLFLQNASEMHNTVLNILPLLNTCAKKELSKMRELPAPFQLDMNGDFSVFRKGPERGQNQRDCGQLGSIWRRANS